MRNFFIGAFLVGAVLSFLAGFISNDKSFFIIAFLVVCAAWLIKSSES